MRLDPERLAWLLWGVVGVVVAVRAVAAPQLNSCVPIFLQGGRDWRDGADLYPLVDDTCRYGPQVVAWWSGLTLLPGPLADLLWRGAGLGLLLLGLALWLRHVCPPAWTAHDRALALLLALP